MPRNDVIAHVAASVCLSAMAEVNEPDRQVGTRQLLEPVQQHGVFVSDVQSA